MTPGPTFVIAEAGVNHNGREDLALALVDAAAAAGADAVKFQTFKADKLVTAQAPKAAYQARQTGAGESQWAMLKRLELSEELHHRLVERCRQRGLAFLSTAFDDGSLAFLLQGLGLGTLKIPSGEITNAPLLLAHARAQLPLLVSTGMATLAEVEAALGVIAFGLTASADAVPTPQAFRDALCSEAGQQALEARVTLLHCTSEYPTPAEDVNLRAMDTLRAAFGLPVGFSDHSEGIAAATAAVARGAVVVEKHFTLDKTLEGPDHRASLDPAELAQLVTAIRYVERALGDGRKGPRPSELDTLAVARKSLVAAAPIAAGEAFCEANLVTMRPGTGISPTRYWDFLGRPAGRAYREGELIDE